MEAWMISPDAAWVLYFMVGTAIFIAGLLLTRKSKDDK